MYSKKLFWVFIVLAVIYLSLVVILPPEAAALARYQITAEQIKLLRLSLAIPIVVIWFLAFYGYDKFKRYADTLAGRKEAGAFRKITNGLLVLALWLPISTIVGNTASSITNKYSEYTAALTIIENYAVIGILLLAFYFLYKGSMDLLKDTKKIAQPKRSFINALFGALSLLFVYWTLTNPVRQFPSDENPTAVYYLPDWLLIPTVIMPYLAIFYFGMISVQNILTYRYKVKGNIYRHALASLANGLGVVVLSVIVIRYFSAFTTQLSEATLKIVLLLVYCLIFLIAIGYIFIALGAKKLQKIEEVAKSV